MGYLATGEIFENMLQLKRFGCSVNLCNKSYSVLKVHFGL